MNNTHPMSTPYPWSLVAPGYASHAQPALEQYARAALEVAGFDSAQKVLDVACGSGTLSLLINDRAEEVHSIDFSPAMLTILKSQIARRGIWNVKTYQMDGQDLGFDDATFDWAFSSFGLMFFADRDRGFREIGRTLKPGGRAVITSWAPVTESTAMQMMFGALRVAFPAEPSSDSAQVLTLEDPDNFRHEMERAGFKDVSVTPFDGDWPVTDAETFFDSMVSGSAPLNLLRSQLDDTVWEAKRASMLSYLRERLVRLPTVLCSRAWIGVGSKG